MTATPSRSAPVAEPRRQFELPEDDVIALDALGYRWEAITAGPVRWLLVHDWPVPRVSPQPGRRPRCASWRATRPQRST